MRIYILCSDYCTAVKPVHTRNGQNDSTHLCLLHLQ